MLKKASSQPSLKITISPDMVYVSTNPSQSSYANLVVTITNPGPGALLVSGITVTLPPTLAPVAGLRSITPVNGQPNLWLFGPSQVTPAEFDAAPVSDKAVQMDANATWTFSLNNVTLVNTITVPVANVSAMVTFADSTSFPQSLQVNIAPAVASVVFNSQPADINPGDTATLSWQCKNIDYCIITLLGPDHLDPFGSRNVTPDSTTVYTLYAYGSGVILSAQWAISVENAQVISFGVSGDTKVDVGDNVTLVWHCNQFTNSVKIDADTGVVIPPLNTDGNTPKQGSIRVGPIMAPTTFTLYAYGSDPKNFDTRIAEVSINDVSVSLTATPLTNLWAGDTITFSWNIKSALKVDFTPQIANGPSLQNLVGSATYSPAADVTTLPCKLTAGGFVDDQKKNVSNDPPIMLEFQPVTLDSFTISPDVISTDGFGNVGTLAWAAHAQNVSIDKLGAVDPVGSQLINAPDNGSIYTLSAGTNQHPAMVSKQIQVVNANGPFTFESIFQTTLPPPGYCGIIVPELGDLKPYIKQPCRITVTGIMMGGIPVTQPLTAYIGLSKGGLSSFTFPPTGAIEWIHPGEQTGTVTVIGDDNN